METEEGDSQSNFLPRKARRVETMQWLGSEMDQLGNKRNFSRYAIQAFMQGNKWLIGGRGGLFWEKQRFG